jgi:hypothetical protein
VRYLFILPWLAVSLLSCYESQEIIVPDNDPTPYDGISTLRIENYLNRLYIDLQGREALNVEVERDVAALRAGDLSIASRDSLVSMLQSDISGGDSSYRNIYFLRLYEQSKVRLLEGVSDGEIGEEVDVFYNEFLKDSLEGDTVGMAYWLEQMSPLGRVLTSQYEYRAGFIEINEMYARMLNNPIYDKINMNSINFIRSAFDNLFFRFPTQAEFDTSFPIIENNQPSLIFGQSASNKEEYIDILVNSREYHEGMIRWAYKSLLAREPGSTELKSAMDYYYQNRDFQEVQRNILTSDEYANF